MSLELLQQDVRSTLLFQAEDRLREKGFLKDYWMSELPQGEFHSINGFDFIQVAADKSINFQDNPALLFTSLITGLRIHSDIQKGLGEVATGLATGEVLTSFEEPFDATNSNSILYPGALGYMMYYGQVIASNNEALTFLGISDEPRESLPSKVIHELQKRIIYEYLRDVNEPQDSEPKNLSLNKLLSFVLPEFRFDIDPTEYPEINNVQRSIANYSLKVAMNFASRNIENTESQIKAIPLKQVNLATNKIEDFSEINEETRFKALTNILMKIAGNLVIENQDNLYKKIAYEGQTYSDNPEHIDLVTLSEEVAETHEAVHTLAKSLLMEPFIYESKVATVVKLGFQQAKYIYSDSKKSF